MTTTDARTDARTVPVTLLRAGAAVLATYAYVVTSVIEPSVVRDWFNRSLNVGEDFGPLAVMLLLACTGYAAAASGFQARQLAWVCAPAVVALALSGLADWYVPLIWVTVLQVVAWLLAIDPLGWPSMLVVLAATAVLCAHGADVEALGRPLMFLPLVLVGHLAWRVLDRTMPLVTGVLLGVGCVAAVLAVHHAFEELERWWYPVAATYAVLLFLTAVRVSGPTARAVAALPATRWLSVAAEWPVLVGPVLVLVVSS